MYTRTLPIVLFVFLIIVSGQVPIEPSESADVIAPMPTGIEPGDLMFVDMNSSYVPTFMFFFYFKGYSNDHIAMYMGDDFHYDDITGGWFINSNGGRGTSFIHRSLIEIKYSNQTYYRVKDADTSLAIEIAVHMVEREDGFRPGCTFSSKKTYDPEAQQQTWYCTELVWAIYYHQGIDIDHNGWGRDYPPLFHRCSAVWNGHPFFYSQNDIKEDDDVVPIFVL